MAVAKIATDSSSCIMKTSSARGKVVGNRNRRTTVFSAAISGGAKNTNRFHVLRFNFAASFVTRRWCWNTIAKSLRLILYRILYQSKNRVSLCYEIPVSARVNSTL